MEAQAYRHTARVNERAWFLRFYLWMWEAEVEKVDFCRLFWGYVFAPLNLLVRAVGAPFYYAFKGIRAGFRSLGDTIESHAPTAAERAQYEKEAERRRDEIRARKEARQARYDEFFKKVSAGVDRTVAFVQRVWRFARWPVFGVAGTAASASAALLIYGAYLAAPFVAAAVAAAAVWIGAWPWLNFVIAAGVLVGVCGSILLLLYILEKTGLDKKIEGSTLGFFGALGTGARSIKSRTCPRIEIVAKDGE